MKKDMKGKVILSTDLMVRSILDDLLKNGIINIPTYNKAVKEAKSYGRDK